MHIIKPNWSAPPNIKAFTVAQSTPQALQEEFSALFVEQIHSNICVNTDESQLVPCDAIITATTNKPLGILTADCLPIIVAHKHKPEIANIHAGWRGLYNGIIASTFQKLTDIPSNYLVWIGPAICVECYNVSDSFRKDFLVKHPHLTNEFKKNQAWHFNLAGAAGELLRSIGVVDISYSQICTYENEQLSSFRRQKNNAGRLATLIWLEE